MIANGADRPRLVSCFLVSFLSNGCPGAARYFHQIKLSGALLF